MPGWRAILCLRAAVRPWVHFRLQLVLEALTSTPHTSGSPAPVGAEIKFLYQVKRVFGQHLEFSTDIRQVAVCPNAAWSGLFVCYYAAILCYYAAILDIGKSVSDEKRVAPDFFNFVIFQVIGVPPFGHVPYQILLDLLLQEQCVPVVRQPVDQYIRSTRRRETISS